MGGASPTEELDGFAVHAIVRAADDAGVARLRDVATNYREDYLRGLRLKGRDAEREAGRLGQDEVRNYLTTSILPRLAERRVILPLDGDLNRDTAIVQVSPVLWKDIAPHRAEFAEAMRETGEHSRLALSTPPRPALVSGSMLDAEGLTKIYRGRKVVNNVAVHLQQGEIVGLLGPNGAGKTTTFYMIVGLIQPLSGRILLEGEDITKLPMYERARRGIGYLSQEPSIFRKLSVEDNILAILETLPLSSAERMERLEKLLDELSIKRLRKSKAYALSGGERRRLEITRALVTDPKFMMLDEPFAGVDPIAVHDIQTIVAGLRHRGIGVLISDHNVEQTLDIVDRAYIMFDGQVNVSGTVRDLVFDDTVADIYLGPTLTARLRDRFSRGKEVAGS
ncbi:MAG TPA: LPS export ABC transporter ATP-binding protein [Gemmatimonadaceae bacterium]|nr:LPS export ABC transporter ATP-binding protein [Gemmatimonadaceae bacterium]